MLARSNVPREQGMLLLNRPVAPPPDILDLARELQNERVAFALATVVRTIAATAAKAGAKALIASDGSISGGWIGGGCARAAVLRAARSALADGRPRLISVQPENLLEEQGVKAGEVRGGVEFANNLCPSQGSMDIFVEPFLPRPLLAIYGASPVAVALAELAARMGFAVAVSAPKAEHEKFIGADRLIDGVDGVKDMRSDFTVVSTQGAGDMAALGAALASGAPYIAFVGSRKKAAALKARFAAAGVPEARLAALRAPAGLDLGAITPDEIAFSIVAEMIQTRRQGQRNAG
jgi:xanthine dehydrogenase accessory factor